MATTTPSPIPSASADAPAATTGPTAARDLIWRLEASGWTQREAANLVALANGLRPANNGWTVREIEHLRFLRSLARAGRVDS